MMKLIKQLMLFIAACSFSHFIHSGAVDGCLQLRQIQMNQGPACKPYYSWSKIPDQWELFSMSPESRECEDILKSKKPNQKTKEIVKQLLIAIESKNVTQVNSFFIPQPISLDPDQKWKCSLDRCTRVKIGLTMLKKKEDELRFWGLNIKDTEHTRSFLDTVKLKILLNTGLLPATEIYETIASVLRMLDYLES